MTVDRIVVTGAAGALGSVLTRHFLRAGRVVTGIDLAETDPVSESGNTRWSYATTDLCDETAAMGSFDEASRRMGGIDLLVNCCGHIVNQPVVGFHRGRLKSHPADIWNHTINANLTAAFVAASQAARIMARQRDGGTIINVGSVSAGGNPGQVAYSAAKAGLVGMSKAMARELGPMGVRVNVIAPGFVDVPTTRAALSEEVLGGIVEKTPLRRLGEADEIIAAIEMVAGNRFITGTVVQVDGGFVL